MKEIPVAVGDLVQLERRPTGPDQWSIRPHLDGLVVKIVRIDKIQGIEAFYGELEGDTVAFYRDAIGRVVGHGLGKARGA